MAIERPPHPLYAALWGLWTIMLWVGAVLITANSSIGVWLLGVTWVAFGLIEGSGLTFNKPDFREQLSEIMTWLLRKNSKTSNDPRWWMRLVGFNAVVTTYSLLISYSAFMFLLAVGVPLWFAWVLPTAVSAYCIPHWFQPGYHG